MPSNSLSLGKVVLAGLFQKAAKERMHSVSAFTVLSSFISYLRKILSQIRSKKFLFTRCHQFGVAEIDSDDSTDLSFHTVGVRRLLMSTYPQYHVSARAFLVSCFYS